VSSGNVKICTNCRQTLDGAFHCMQGKAHDDASWLICWRLTSAVQAAIALAANMLVSGNGFPVCAGAIALQQY
jgi:hypothetical protein